MSSIFEDLYSYDFDYKNESVQKDFYERSKNSLEKISDYIPYKLIFNYKCVLILREYGNDSEYLKYLYNHTSFDKDMFTYLLEHKVLSVQVEEFYEDRYIYINDVCFKGN